MVFDYIAMLDELPKDPKGWTRQMTVHLSFGRGKGMASYEIFDDKKQKTPITFMYDTRAGQRGFMLPGVKSIMSWPELRGMWEVWIGHARAKQRRMTQKAG